MSTKTTASSILIGGAEGNLGRHALSFFAKRGLKVVGACRTDGDRERTQEFVRTNTLKNVTLLTCDLGDEQAVGRLVVDAAKAAGPLDAVFNAAGGFRYGATVDAPISDYEFLVTANFKSCFLLGRAVAKGMVERGFGRIVFVSSRATLGTGEANMGLYVASKAAVNALVGSLAAEHKKTPVTINAVMPTTIDTPANREAMPKANFADWVTPEALLEVVHTLIGPTGVPINGALIPVAGRL